jgi:hypothetical protein
MEERPDTTVPSGKRKSAATAAKPVKRRRDDDFGEIDGVEDEQEEAAQPHSS